MAPEDTPDPTSSGESDFTTRSSMGESSSSALDELERVAKCRILKQIGAGGMGVVYEAQQEHPVRRKVALKVVKFGVEDKEAIARFEAERQALALMDHPNVAQVFDAGTTLQGRPYFVMDLVDGEPLGQHCDRHALSTRDRLEIFIPVCNAIQHAHQKGIIHRDLKPSNILVTLHDGKPVPKVIDFGIAKATDAKLTDKTLLTQHGQFMGTPDYMSPEQAQGLPDVDTRTDVYALGVVLYELLTGTLPFDPKRLRQAGHTEMLRIIGEEEPPQPSARVGTLGPQGTSVAAARRTVLAKLRGQLQGDLDWITMKALEMDRTRRYASATELAADLQRHLRDEPVSASPPGRGYRLKKFARRHRVGVVAGSVVVASLVVAAVVSVLFALSEAQQRRLAAAERDRANAEAQTSDRVSEFLVSVFNVSDPGEARGNSVTAREVLDNGALRIQRELNDEPLLRAKMMDTMGRVYQNLGLYAMADSLLVGAMELRKNELGEEHLDSAESRSHLGWLRLYQGRLDEARSNQEKALATRERLLGAEDVDTAWSLYYLGTSEIFSGELSQGRRRLERALPVFERELGPHHYAVGWCLNDLGNAVIQTDPASALPFFERAFEVKKTTLGLDHYDVGMALIAIARCLLHLKRLPEARSRSEQAVPILEKTLGPNHVLTANALQTRGAIRRDQGDYEGARHDLHRAADIFNANVEPLHYAYLYLNQDLAQLAQGTGDFARADSLFRRALEVGEKSLHPDHPDVGKLLDDYAVFLRQVGRLEEAVAAEARARAIRDNLKQTSDAN